MIQVLVLVDGMPVLSAGGPTFLAPADALARQVASAALEDALALLDQAEGVAPTTGALAWEERDEDGDLVCLAELEVALGCSFVEVPDEEALSAFLEPAAVPSPLRVIPGGRA